MTEKSPNPANVMTTDQCLQALEVASAYGGGEDPLLAELAIGAVGEARIDDNSRAAVNTLNLRLDEVNIFAGEEQVVGSLRTMLRQLEVIEGGPGGLDDEQDKQIVIIRALLARSAAVTGPTAVPPGRAPWAARARARRQAGPTGSGGSSVGPAGRASSAGGGAGHRKRAAARRTAAAVPSTPGPGTGPAAPNKAKSLEDTFKSRFENLLAVAVEANKKRGNGHPPEAITNNSEQALWQIVSALAVDPASELPITADRQHPEEDPQESVIESAEFIVEARQLFLQFGDRIAGTAPSGDPAIFVGVEGWGGKSGKPQFINAKFVDMLGDLTDPDHWIVDDDTQNLIDERLRQMYRVGINLSKNLQGFQLDNDKKFAAGQGMKELIAEFKGAGNDPAGGSVQPEALIKFTPLDSRGKVVQVNPSNPVRPLEVALVVFHEAQSIKRVELSNWFKLYKYNQSVVQPRVDTLMWHPADMPEDEVDELIEQALEEGELLQDGEAQRIRDDYAYWVLHLYDGIDPRDGTRIMGPPFPPGTGGGAPHGRGRPGPRAGYPHHAFPPVHSGVLDFSFPHSQNGLFPTPPRPAGSSVRNFRTNAGAATQSFPAVEADSGLSPVERSKLKLQQMYREDRARRKTEAREARSQRRRIRVANAAAGLLLTLPEPVQDRVATAVRRSTAKRSGRIVLGQNHS